MITVYAAGPIDGCTIEQAIEWRLDLKIKLTSEIKSGYINVLDPMSGKEKLVPPGQIITTKNYGNPNLAPTLNASAIFHRDIMMINQADIILANFQITNTTSKGTMFELGYAYYAGKTIIIVSDKDSIILHPFINVPAIVYQDMTGAICYLKSLITAGIGR